MRENLKNFLEQILNEEKLKNLHQNGVLVFDVDDTLLARRKTPNENDQIYSESPAARLLPSLLNAGFSVCVITGHGWKQLKERLVEPLVKDLEMRFPRNRNEILKEFFIYANRGATKIIREQDSYKADTGYSDRFSYSEKSSACIKNMLGELKSEFEEDFEKRKYWYLENFKSFSFYELPPRILERENVILGLRPIPSKHHSANKINKSPRDLLFKLGRKKMIEKGLETRFSIDKSGKSTLEISRRGISKQVAFKDLIAQISVEKKVSAKTVENSSVYIGDEFDKDGNDLDISDSFRECLCLSVGLQNKMQELVGNVIALADHSDNAGIEITEILINHCLNTIRVNL